MIYVQLVTQLYYLESLQTEFTLLSKGGGVMEQTHLLLAILILSQQMKK